MRFFDPRDRLSKKKRFSRAYFYDKSLIFIVLTLIFFVQFFLRLAKSFVQQRLFEKILEVSSSFRPFIAIFTASMKNAEQLHLYPMPDNRVTAFSTTRHGGCGSGTYGTFNCTPYTGDEFSVVLANQEKLCRLVGVTADKLIVPYQTHSCNVLTIDEAFMQLSGDARHAMLQEKDAVITSIPNVCLCVSTADCVPVLLYDSARGVIASVHAGWRGTVGKIVAHTI